MRPGRVRPGRAAGLCGRDRGHPASMRPGRVRPGRVPRPGSDQRALDASMRPGRVRPGRDHPEPGAPGSRHHASMRPGRVRPGRVTRRLRSGPVANSFNEAGARTPRKSRSSSTTTPASNGFNEAGARTPRKRPRRGERAAPRAGASMRPGRVRPGRAVAAFTGGSITPPLASRRLQ